MPIFQYSGSDKDGSSVKGQIEADSAKAARQKLKRSGYLIFSIEERSAKKGQSELLRLFFGTRSVPVPEMTVMTRQLASLVKANIPLVEAITAVMEQSEHDTLKAVLADVRQNVNEGTSLSKACGKHPKIFSPLFINMIDAGESSGTLPLVLVRLADFMESQLRLATKVKSAMIYPLLMVVVGGGLMLGIFTFVIPRIAKIFDSMNKSLPWYTEVILNISNFIVSYWALLLIAGLIAGAVTRAYLGTERGKLRRDRFALVAPGFGEVVRMVGISRFSNTMSTLLNGGVPIITALGIAKTVVNNKILAEAITLAQENISEGQSLAGPLKKSGEFPALIIHMISVGERTGELPQMLEMVASTYEEQATIKIDRFTTLLEPVMILVMGGAVGVIVLAVFAPLLQLQQLV